MGQDVVDVHRHVAQRGDRLTLDLDGLAGSALELVHYQNLELLIVSSTSRVIFAIANNAHDDGERRATGGITKSYF
jgi:hypothetical protein